MMVLRTGDVGDRVKTLQRGLNKLGAMLLVDGQFGAGTRDAVADARVALGCPGPPEADDELQAAVAAVPDPFPSLTAAGVTFIARAEVSNAGMYQNKYRAPCWPSAESGMTIGIGYDCQFVRPEQLYADWAGVLPSHVIDQLVPASGKVGSQALLTELGAVLVPLSAAMTVFARRSLPEFLKRARAIYPEVDDLAPARRTALVSLVYNRGARLHDKDEARQDRREMRTIRELLASGQHDLVAGQFDLMARLWDPTKLAGLIQRRRAEATLWRAGFGALQLE